jgi:hypothetical protein
MAQDDTDFLQRRHAQERARAANAALPIVRNVHAQLASAYEKRLTDIEAATRPRLGIAVPR